MAVKLRLGMSVSQALLDACSEHAVFLNSAHKMFFHELRQQMRSVSSI